MDIDFAGEDGTAPHAPPSISVPASPATTPPHNLPTMRQELDRLSHDQPAQKSQPIPAAQPASSPKPAQVVKDGANAPAWTELEKVREI